MLVSIVLTRRYDTLQAPTSSSCGGLVAFGHLEGPSGPLDPIPLPQVTVDIDPSFIVILIILTNCAATQWLLGLATWQQCKKHDRGEGGGPARVWGF